MASSEAVPEPGSITLVVSGGLCLLAYVWRGRIGCRAARLSLVLLTSLLSGQPVLYRGVVVVIANCRRLLCVVALFIIGSWFAAPGDAGLVQLDGLYTFSDPANLGQDSSGWGNDLNVVGSVIYRSSGGPGFAGSTGSYAEFDGAIAGCSRPLPAW